MFTIAYSGIRDNCSMPSAGPSAHFYVIYSPAHSQLPTPTASMPSIRLPHPLGPDGTINWLYIIMVSLPMFYQHASNIHSQFHITTCNHASYIVSIYTYVHLTTSLIRNEKRHGCTLSARHREINGECQRKWGNKKSLAEKRERGKIRRW